ncbi:hypothetical protein KEM60_02100 [Austwickia sp. TVS 96-490-7B]|nr:hypothetical protein [Austwickia sp. TVS 96-490-7B]
MDQMKSSFQRSMHTHSAVNSWAMLGSLEDLMGFEAIGDHSSHTFWCAELCRQSLELLTHNNGHVFGGRKWLSQKLTQLGLDGNIEAYCRDAGTSRLQTLYAS